MSDNLKIWQAFADIDPQFTKPITGKAYKGTSPNPHYVIMCLTNLFGPVGQGFGWEVLSDGFERLGDEVLHWCRIRFWHTNRENWFEAYGQTKAVLKTKNGPLVDEDAPKKSLTDAIVKAASQLGIAANIFLGRWDDAKYVAEVNAEYREQEQPTRSSAALKRANSWERIMEQFQQDALDCKTLVALESLKAAYRKMAKDEGWTAAWLSALKNEFDKLEDQIAREMEKEAA